MSVAPFSQNVIAMVWDFDKTLIQTYMQEPLFKRYQIDDKTFWTEVNALANYYSKQGIHINRDTCYLNHILTYVKEGRMKGLNNRILRECGAELKFYPGLPLFFKQIKELIENDSNYKSCDIRLEHYVVSTGFAETIQGSAIAPYVDGIFGCEFIETPAPSGFIAEYSNSKENEISQIAIALDNTSKTRYLFEINKGSNKFPETIDVNSFIEPENRRIPFRNMLYIADGPSDVPAFSILNNHQGSTFAIYPKGDSKAFKQVEQLRKDKRIETFGEADYSEGTHTWMWLTTRVKEIADGILKRHKDTLQKSSSVPPGHLSL